MTAHLARNRRPHRAQNTTGGLARGEATVEEPGWDPFAARCTARDATRPFMRRAPAGLWTGPDRKASAKGLHNRPVLFRPGDPGRIARADPAGTQSGGLQRASQHEYGLPSEPTHVAGTIRTAQLRLRIR